MDNPEYFHMPERGDPVGSDEAQVPSQTSKPEPTKGKPPPSLSLALSTPADEISELLEVKEGCFLRTSSADENGEVTSSVANGTNEIGGNEANDEAADSDEPPEVPPRSECLSLPSYVNSCASSNHSSFLGDYIYTSGESGVIVENANDVSRPISSGSEMSSGPRLNGVTAVHNLLYRSIPPPPYSSCANDLYSVPRPVGSPTSPTATPAPIYQHPMPTGTPTSPTSTTAPIYQHPPPPVTPTSPMGSPAPIYQHPPPPVSILSPPDHLSLVPNPVFPHYCIPKTPVIVSPTDGKSNGHTPGIVPSKDQVPLNDHNGCNDVGSSSEITKNGSSGSEVLRSFDRSKVSENFQSDIVISEAKKQKAIKERLSEEAIAEAEKARLDEILSMCAEYQRQNSGGDSVKDDLIVSPRTPVSPTHTLTQNRIKTNGSLPRDKRSPLRGSCLSPTSPSFSGSGAHTPSEDELDSIFAFGAENSSTVARSSVTSPSYPGFPNFSPGVASPSLPQSSRSPYENVPTSPPGQKVPHSPRTRIRTTVRDKSEVFENKLAVLAEMGSRRTPEPVSVSSPTTSNGHSRPQTLPRTPRIDRDVFQDLDSKVISNKFFLEKTPDAKSAKLQSNGPCKGGMNATSSLTQSRSSAGTRSPTTDPGLDADNSNFSLESLKFRNKNIADQMMRNIQDTLNIENIAGEVVRLKEHQNNVMKATNALKVKIAELERLENEALRELEMERALVEGELKCTKETLLKAEEKKALLVTRKQDMIKRHDDEREQENLMISECLRSLEDASQELDSNVSPEMSSGKAEGEARPQVDVESEKKWKAAAKRFEDLEFAHLESETLRESELEEIHHEIDNISMRIVESNNKIVELETQMVTVTAQMRREAVLLEEERQQLIADMNKELMHAGTVERRLAEFARLGVAPPPGGRLSPSLASDTDESCNSDLADRMAKLHLLDRSQDDLDRIHQVTNSSPLDHSDGTLGRRTSAALLEVEKNRQLTLVKEGSDVIDRERRKMDELKKRAASEVRSQWEVQRGLSDGTASEVRSQWEVQRGLSDLNSSPRDPGQTASTPQMTKSQSLYDAHHPGTPLSHFTPNDSGAAVKRTKEQRDVNCASLNSVGSEDSSMTSSDLPTESMSSDEILASQRSSGDASRSDHKMRQNECGNSGSSGERFRPLSEASSVCDSDGHPVRYRSKSQTQQRPLTQYLPVRSEHFDLRQHIISAGHQIELCPYVLVNHTSCRGYLHKLGSKFRTWQKRWFIFDRNQRAFLYFGDKSEGRVKGGTYFKAIEDVYVDHLHSLKSPPNPKLTFCVKTHERTFKLLAPSPEAMRIWIDVIFTGAEGYVEFSGAS